MLDQTSPIFEIPEELRNNILAIFITEAGELVELIQTGLKEKNEVQVKSAAHKLKGSSATVGANKLSEIAGNLELSEFTDPLLVERLKLSFDELQEYLS